MRAAVEGQVLSMKAKKKVAAICATVAIAGGGALATASPAAASPPPVAVGGSVVMSAPTPYSSLVGGFFVNTYIAEYCWTDYGWSYGTNRWFYISGPGYDPHSGRFTWVSGYISANRVFNQFPVRHC
jgi:hypothetical protein